MIPFSSFQKNATMIDGFVVMSHKLSIDIYLSESLVEI